MSIRCPLNSTIPMCVCVCTHICLRLCVQPSNDMSHSHLMIAASHWLPSLLPDQIQLLGTIETSSGLRTPSAPLCCCSLLQDSCWTPNHVKGPQGPRNTPVCTHSLTNITHTKESRKIQIQIKQDTKRA